MAVIAKIAVQAGRNRFLILDYTVSAQMEGLVVPGIRVLAPIREEIHEGLVLQRGQGDPEGLKPLDQVVGTGPVVTEELLLVLRWVADYYMAPLGEVVRLGFPSFTRGKLTEMYWVQAGTKEIRDVVRLHPEAGRLADYVAGKSHFSRAALERNFGRETAATCLQWLIDRGFVSRFSDFQPVKRVRQKQMVSLLVQDTERLALPKTAFKQVQVVTYLKKVGSPRPVSEIYRETGANRVQLRALEKKSAVRIHTLDGCSFQTALPAGGLCAEQAEFVHILEACASSGVFAGFLLTGDLRNQRTAVYLRAAAAVVKEKKQALFVVPEIALTSELVRPFQAVFGERAVVLHSKLSRGERYSAWKKMQAGEADVVIGTRSAVFAPVPALGLIIVDDEHDRSLKEEASPRYHAREVAIYRSRVNDAILVLGSATPSMESLHLVEKAGLRKLELGGKHAERTPKVEIVDMREEMRQGNPGILSRAAKNRIKKTLAQHQQVLVYLNRRGYAPFFGCRSCGWVIKCVRCDVSLTYHSAVEKLKCHYCGHQAQVPSACPKCGSTRITPFGVGTQRAEEFLKNVFKGSKIVRVDADTARKNGAGKKMLEAFSRGEYDIMIGTQMIEKSTDFPNLGLVCVLAADTGVNLPDFRAGERTFQLLAPVIAKAGCSAGESEVILQAYNPENPTLACLWSGNYLDFSTAELHRRKDMGYPPYCSLVRIVFASRSEASAMDAASRVADDLLAYGIGVMGPAPAPLQRVRGVNRWQIMIRCLAKATKAVLSRVVAEERVRSSRAVKVIMDVDPQSMF